MELPTVISLGTSLIPMGSAIPVTRPLIRRDETSSGTHPDRGRKERGEGEGMGWRSTPARRRQAERTVSAVAGERRQEAGGGRVDKPPRSMRCGTGKEGKMAKLRRILFFLIAIGVSMP